MTTPTQKAIDTLIGRGYQMTAVGGDGFIMPRYWIFKRPDSSSFVATKTKHLTAEIKELEK